MKRMRSRSKRGRKPVPTPFQPGELVRIEGRPDLYEVVSAAHDMAKLRLASEQRWPTQLVVLSDVPIATLTREPETETEQATNG